MPRITARWVQRAGPALAVCALGGCAAPAPGPLSLSLNELGSEVRVDAGSLFGALTVDPDPPLLFAIPSLFSKPSLPDQLALRLSPGCSEVLVQDLAGSSELQAADVLALRDGMQALEAAAFPLFRQQALQAVVSGVLGLLPAEAASAGPGAASAPPAAAAADAQALDAAV